MPPSRQSLCESIIIASLEKKPSSREDFLLLKRAVSARAKQEMPTTAALRRTYLDLVKREPARASAVIESYLQCRKIRSISGIAVVTVLTKPYPCPGKCVYCPTEAIMPKSYLSNEPAAMRALLQKFDPWKQVTSRLRALVNNGHDAEKIELIVKGGTWSAYPWDYQQWFIKRCFDACNQFGSARRKRTSTLLESQDVNESATYRIIGLTIETRPDWITPKEIIRLRALGCTRVELGVQSVSDRLLDLTKRGHDVASIVRAARLLKDTGYKTDFHIMPQLPGATPLSDLEEIRELFRNPDFRPDMLKIYPCVVVEDTELYGWWKNKTYTPYPDADLIEMLVRAKQDIPRYCRISRLIRDIPSTSIVAGNMATNLRETIQKRMAELGVACACLRCREIGRASDAKLANTKPKLFDDKYEASGGVEHFLSFEDADRKAVFAFCRLRLPDPNMPPDVAEARAQLPELDGAAFLRELHTYGRIVPIDERDPDASQHKGLGRQLMERAEQIARDAGYKKLAVISGIGVRDYYRKLGYRREGSYMTKRLS